MADQDTGPSRSFVRALLIGLMLAAPVTAVLVSKGQVGVAVATVLAIGVACVAAGYLSKRSARVDRTGPR